MTRYEQGFMNKCAEYGVDMRGLLKFAATLLTPMQLSKIFSNESARAALEKYLKRPVLADTDRLRVMKESLSTALSRYNSARASKPGFLQRLFSPSSTEQYLANRKAMRNKLTRLENIISKYESGELSFKKPSAVVAENIDNLKRLGRMSAAMGENSMLANQLNSGIAANGTVKDPLYLLKKYVTVDKPELGNALLDLNPWIGKNNYFGVRNPGRNVAHDVPESVIKYLNGIRDKVGINDDISDLL